MIYGECLALVKMNKYSNAFGESADSSVYEKFFSIQNKFLASYAAYLEKIENMINKIGEDVEIRVITKVPVINTDDLIKFEQEWNETYNRPASSNIDVVIPESSFEIDDRVAKEPPYKEVNNLKDYLQLYSVFVSEMDDFRKSIKNKLFYLKEQLIEMSKLATESRIDAKIEWYLNVLSAFRKYLIKYVEYAESLKNTIDDD